MPNRRGLTLIELLIVVTILGILASITVIAFGKAPQEKSRDSRRKTDLDTLKKGLELAKLDSTGAYYYPSCDVYTSGECRLSGTATNPDLTLSSGTPYINNVPNDPKTNLGYLYRPTGAVADCAVNTCTSYTLVACLEFDSDTQKDPTNDATACVPGSGTVSYTIRPN